MASEQKINNENYPYQVINGKVYNSSISCRQLGYSEFLIKKPLVPLLAYLKAEGANIKGSVEWCNCSIKIGDLEALQWLQAGGAPWSKWVCNAAVWNGHLEVLKWLRAGGAPWDTRVCYYALLKGHLIIFFWAYVNGCPCSEDCALQAEKVINNCKKVIGTQLHKCLTEFVINYL